ncbi:TPA: hypothetical protein PTV44_002582 [Clostridium botulinum]|nr:hypothetical protein [Clostridium botulinum]
MKDGIYTLYIAEVENLFIIEEIFKVIAEQLVRNENDVKEVKNFVIDLFEKNIETQIKNAVVSEIKYKLSIYDVNKGNEQEIKFAIDKIAQLIKVDEIFMDKKEQFDRLNQEKNYANILKYFNNKGLYKSVGGFFGLQNNEYSDLVIRLLRSSKKSKIIEGLKNYLPSIN